MKLFVLFLVICLSKVQIGISAEVHKKTVCLNMIVKNEKDVITRCLQSVLPVIDTWVIVDTGSTDGTQTIIKEFLKDIPGTLYERPWVNFGHNRNEALELSKNKADYLLFMDADDTLSFARDRTFPELSADFYACFAVGGGQKTLLPRLVKASLEWKWHGAIHEYIRGISDTQGSLLEGVEYIYRHDGARGKDPKALEKDILCLEEAIKNDPQNSRNVFYLGKTYQAFGKLEEAFIAFTKRSQMQGFQEEVFLSKLAVAQIQNALQKESTVVEMSFLSAYLSAPHRVEPIYYLIEKWMQEGKYEKGFELAQLRLQSSMTPSDELFVEEWIYDFGLLMQYAQCAMHTKQVQAGIEACRRLLGNSKLPKTFQETVQIHLKEMQERQMKQIQEELQQLLKL